MAIISPIDLQAQTILIIEDDPVNLGIIVDYLESYGFKIAIARDGSSGLKRAGYVQPDLILLDVMMPGIDGFETCRRLKADEQTKNIPVIFMTALTAIEDIITGFEVGAVDYITKPFQVAEVLARLKTHLALCHLQKQLETQNVQLQQEMAERQRIEEALTAERNLLRTLIDNLPDYIFVKDTGSRFMLANTTTTRRFGATTGEELVGKTDFDFLPPDMAAQFYATEQELFHSGQALIDREELNVDRAGVKSWFLTTKIPLRDSRDQIVGLVGITRDITGRKQIEEALQKAHAELEQRVAQRTAELAEANTNLKAEISERKQAEEALTEQHHLLRTLIDTIPDAIYVKDTESRFLAANNAVARLMGTTPDQLIGRRDHDFYPPNLAAEYYADEQAIIASGQPLINKEEPALDHAGKVAWILTTKVPFLDNQGRIKGIVGVGHDITQRREMEQTLRQAHDRLEERVEQRTAELKQANEQLAALYKVGQIITAPLQLNAVLEAIARNTAELLRADTGVILLLDEAGKTLTIQGAYGLSQQLIQNTRDSVGESIAGRVVQTSRPIIANDLPNHPFFYNPAAANEGLLACASAPLVAGGRIIGTLDVHSKTDRQAFNEDHIHILSMLANQAAIAIENARLYEELQQAHARLEARVQQRTAELAQANASLQLEIVERQRTEVEIQRRNRDLTLLNRVIAASVTETEPKAILEIVCRELAIAFELPSALAALLNKEKTETALVAGYVAPGQP
ncbi:MAG: PAS domain-containing protein, partial [Chloroflexota bacterium]